MKLPIILTAVVLIAGVVIGVLTAKPEPAPEPALETSEDVVSPEVIALQGQIENWDQYLADTTVEVGTGDCGNADFTAALAELNAGERKLFKLNGELPLVLTPNPKNWTEADFAVFVDDENKICAAGGVYPVRAFPDKLLWAGVCGTGAEPQNDAERAQLEQCLLAEEAISEYYAAHLPELPADE